MSENLPQMMPLTALGGDTPRVDTHGPVTLTEISHLALASVAARLGQEDACRAHLIALLGGSVPGVEQLVLHEPEAGFWIGPDQWMIGAPHDSHEDLAAQLVQRFGETASITEQNDAWAVFDLEGDVAPVMELLCPINMRAFPAGSARRSSIDHLGCFVTCRADTHLRILGPRSSAGSLHHALLTAMKSAH
ncbi:sarcosine oxidase subunit gamma [Primorskyibacter sp. S187A]|uniref:sarcosine oxidase subunit gamma n=1 Tax=Primorskyibacter sp. S187A TaxID=3415130 RepID=UPI003C7D587C